MRLWCRSGDQRGRRSPAVLAMLAILAGAGGCGRTPVEQHELTGQVIAVDPARLEITIAHEPIPGYMDAMAMPVKVRDSALLAGLEAGHLVRGRLVVTRSDGYLETLERTGSRPRPVTSSLAFAGALSDSLLEGDRIPDVALIDQDGRRRRLREDPEAAVVLTFVYTRCPFPTFCPLIDRRFRSLQDLIVTDPELSTRTRLLSITLDPSRDTPAILKQHAAGLGADSRVWSFAVPDEPVPGEFAARFGVTAVRDERDAQLIVHRLVTVTIDPRGIITRIFRGGDWEPGQVVDALRPSLARARVERR